MADLNRTDADVTMFLLNQNSMKHPNPVNDPYFSAHRRADIDTRNLTLYTADALTSAIACAEQFQIRNDHNNATTPMTSSVVAWWATVTLGMSEAQLATAYRLLATTDIVLMGRSITILPGDALLASQRAYSTLSTGLPDDQWQIELRGWFEEALASTQFEVMAYASKSIDGLSPYGQLIIPNISSVWEAMCNQQIMRNTGGFQSFSVLGISLILALGACIYMVNWFLETIVTAIRKKRRRNEAKSAEWRMDMMLYQQCIAFAAVKHIRWEKTDSEVPITSKDVSFSRIGS